MSGDVVDWALPLPADLSRFTEGEERAMKKKHLFKGRRDRWCEICNLPDRNPIHRVEAVDWEKPMLRQGFQKQVAQMAIDRGLSRASVICALLIAAGKADTRRIAPADWQRCLAELELVPPDVARSAAFNNLCQCVENTHYDVTPGEEREKHLRKCRYVLYCDLIGEPLPSMLEDD